MAAGHAVEAIAAIVPRWKPEWRVKEEQEEDEEEEEAPLLNYEVFDVETVIAKGQPLLACEGKVPLPNYKSPIFSILTTFPSHTGI